MKTLPSHHDGWDYPSHNKDKIRHFHDVWHDRRIACSYKMVSMVPLLQVTKKICIKVQSGGNNNTNDV